MSLAYPTTVPTRSFFGAAGDFAKSWQPGTRQQSLGRSQQDVREPPLI